MEWVAVIVSMDPPGVPSPAVVPPAAAPEPTAAQERTRGWPLPLKLLLAALVLAFVWSPFLAMLYRLSQPNPSLAPTAIPGSGTPTLPAPAITPAAGETPPAGRSSRVPSP